MDPSGVLQRRNIRQILSILAGWALLMLLTPQPSAAEGAGYAEYYITGHEQQLWDIFVDLDNDPVLDAGQGSHTTIAVATETDSTTIYYDHWEDGYDFDADALDPTAHS